MKKRSVKYVNENEIRVWAIRSSGQHAVINWIASLFDPPVVFCNNARPTCTPYFHTPNVNGKELAQLYYPTWEIKRNKRQQEMLKLRKQCLIYNHENGDFKNWGWHAGEVEIGASKHRYDVLVMRSFKNLLASWLVNPPYKWDKFEEQIVPLYKLYADEFLRATNELEFQTVPVWFDTWTASTRYRQRKARAFGKKNREWTLQFMANFSGRGSHFDNFRKHYRRAREMKVNERYKKMQDHPKYIELMNKYSHLNEISNSIHEKAGLL